MICKLLPLIASLSIFVSISHAQNPHCLGIWISNREIAALPMTGKAWQALKFEADKPTGTPEIRNQDDDTNVRVLAKALVYARTGYESYRKEVIRACMAAIGSERGARTLALGRELMAYVIAADLVGLPPDKDALFRKWLGPLRREYHKGRSLISTHEDRPNNWGTHAGASRLAVALYLQDSTEVKNCARVFKGWLGDRNAYAGFKFGKLYWQADPERPVAINPAGATMQQHDIDGVLPDDQRRAGDFIWPPPKENYVYEALQGALAQAVMLYRAGYEDVWQWSDQALLRAFQWLQEVADYPAEGDDTWQPYVVNYYYGTNFPTIVPTRPGKNVGWTDWTHAVPPASN